MTDQWDLRSELGGKSQFRLFPLSASALPHIPRPNCLSARPPSAHRHVMDFDFLESPDLLSQYFTRNFLWQCLSSLHTCSSPFALAVSVLYYNVCAIAFTSIRPSFVLVLLLPSGPDQLSIEEISLERPMDGRSVGRSLGTGAPFCPAAAATAAIEVGGDDDGGDSDP